jgi:hypothetical protein
MARATDSRKIAGQIAGQTAFEGGEGLISLGKLVPPARFQRATFRLGGGRSMQLSYGSTRENRKW